MQRPKVKAADFVGREAYLAPARGAVDLRAQDRAVHADRRGPHLRVRDEAVHARRRADPDPRRRHPDRRPRPPPLRDVGGLGTLAGQARPAGVPAARAGRDRHRAGRVLHGGALPRRRRLGGRHLAVRPGQRADALMGDPMRVLVCVKRVPDSSSQVVLTPDDQAVDGRIAGLHDQPARGVRDRARRPHRRRDRRPGHGADAGARRVVGAAAHARWRSGCGAAVHVEADGVSFGPADVAREIAAVVQAHSDEGRGVRPGPARQRRLRHRRLPGRHPARLRARAARGQRRLDARGRRRGRLGPCRRSGRTGDLLGADPDGGDRPGGRRRAALPHAQGPDGGQEGRDREPVRDRHPGRLEPDPAAPASPGSEQRRDPR